MLLDCLCHVIELGSWAGGIPTAVLRFSTYNRTHILIAPWDSHGTGKPPVRRHGHPTGNFPLP